MLEIGFYLVKLWPWKNINIKELNAQIKRDKVFNDIDVHTRKNQRGSPQKRSIINVFF